MTGTCADLDGGAPHHPAVVAEAGVAGVVVGDVLQVAGERVEPQPAARAGVAEAHPPPAGVDPPVGRQRQVERVIGHGHRPYRAGRPIRFTRKVLTCRVSLVSPSTVRGSLRGKDLTR